MHRKNRELIPVTVANDGLWGSPTKNAIILVLMIASWRIDPMNTYEPDLCLCSFPFLFLFLDLAQVPDAQKSS